MTHDLKAAERQRLAEALRANLKRRKAARPGAPARSPGESEDAPAETTPQPAAEGDR